MARRLQASRPVVAGKNSSVISADEFEHIHLLDQLMLYTGIVINFSSA